MNNLLRTLTESQAKSAHSDTDLKLLLSTVKDGRRQSNGYDTKLSDPFYDSLEGLLLDLRTVTIDNHDAEAFLKPVAKADAPDYYDVISNPMDLQTMLKKVKQKQYKSKREFKDDLDLIWSNCFTYNATESHPLRKCVKRLKVKAERLLKNITDRKERTDPPIASVARPTLNASRSNGSGFRTPAPTTARSSPSTSVPPIPKFKHPSQTPVPRDAPFPDSLAIIRTPDDMSTFLQLDRQVHTLVTSPQPHHDLAERLRELAPHLHDNEDLGDKRKAATDSNTRPRKRTRFNFDGLPIPVLSEDPDVSQLWWGAVQSDVIIGNGLPGIPFSSSSSSSSLHDRKPKRRKASVKTKPKQKQKQTLPPQPKSLLALMNNNIRTMKRVRRTHAKFGALSGSNNTNNTMDEEGDVEMGGGLSGGGGFAGDSSGSGVGDDVLGVGVGVDDEVDERPWSLTLNGNGAKTGKKKHVEIGEENAADCVRWMGGKVLEHAGFQGASKVALNVLAGVTSEYLLNVGRTIRFLCDKYSSTMTAEEIILHTLFESGTSKVQDLERYISEDVERYGARLGDLEKKLVGAYKEATVQEVPEDEGLFDDEDNEEDGGALVMGNFADAFGEDFLGLRELGIAAEYNLSSLSIPKRLLKGKKAGQKATDPAAKPTEPPLPFPLPPAFIPLESTKVDDQIGLLKSYYQNRFAALAPPGSTTTSLPGAGTTLAPGAPPVTTSNTAIPVLVPGSTVPIILPDDPPNPTQIKMGPLGQIVKQGSSSTAGGTTAAGKKKKKAKIKEDGGEGEGPDGEAKPKKKKGNTGVGTGNGRKKKLLDAQLLEQQHQQKSMLPPPVVAV